MYIYTGIKSDDDKFMLSALIDQDSADAKYEMPHFEIFNEGETEIWDSEEFLIGTLYPFVCNDIGDEDLQEMLNDDEKKEIRRMFKYAISNGFFASYFDKVKKEINEKLK